MSEANTRFAFVGANVVHAVGFERLGREFHLLAARAGDLPGVLADRGAHVEYVTDDPDEAKSSESLLALRPTADYMRLHNIQHVVLFKDSARTEKIARTIGCRVLAAPPRVARRLENKSHLATLAHGAGVLTPESRVVPAAEADYETMAATLGMPYVAQAPKGFGGAKTYVVETRDDLEVLRENYGDRPLKFSTYVQGEYATVVACATRAGVIAGPSAFQITGVAQCTPHPLGSCGNDLTYGDIERRRETMPEVANAVGEALVGGGYEGVFGIDVILSSRGPYLVDVNPRFVASLPLYTALQMEVGLTPFIETHLRIHGGESLAGSPAEDHTAVDSDASSLIVYSLDDGTTRIRTQLQSGVYEIKTMQYLRCGADVSDLSGATEVLILPRPKGTAIRQGTEIARCYFRRGIMATNSQLAPEVEAIVRFVRERMTSDSAGESDN